MTDVAIAPPELDEPCDVCADPDNPPGVLFPMNTDNGVQRCDTCSRFESDLSAALELAGKLGENAWFVCQDATDETIAEIRRVTAELVHAVEDEDAPQPAGVWVGKTWFIARGTDPWIGEWDENGYDELTTDDGRPVSVHPTKRDVGVFDSTPDDWSNDMNFRALNVQDWCSANGVPMMTP